jgi:hypothetical protein
MSEYRAHRPPLQPLFWKKKYEANFVFVRQNFFMFERTNNLYPHFWIGTPIPPTHPVMGGVGGVGQVPFGN